MFDIHFGTDESYWFVDIVGFLIEHFWRVEIDWCHIMLPKMVIAWINSFRHYFMNISDESLCQYDFRLSFYLLLLISLLVDFSFILEFSYIHNLYCPDKFRNPPFGSQFAFGWVLSSTVNCAKNHRFSVCLECYRSWLGIGALFSFLVLVWCRLESVIILHSIWSILFHQDLNTFQIWMNESSTWTL